MRIWRWVLRLFVGTSLTDLENRPYYDDGPRQREADAAATTRATQAGMHGGRGSVG